MVAIMGTATYSIRTMPKITILSVIGLSIVLLSVWQFRILFDVIPNEQSSQLSPAFLVTDTSFKAHELASRAENRTLWLVTCETRLNDIYLKEWTKSAVRFRDSNLPYVDNIRIKNVCENKKWNGFMLKIEMGMEFLQSIMMEHEDRAGSHIMMVTDSDCIFNPFAATFPQVLQRFDEARNGRPILISAAPDCWVGRKCNIKDLEQLYPNATKHGSSCPQFVNAGQVVAYVPDLFNMYNETYHMKQLYGPKWMKDDDQFRIAVYHRQNPSKAVMDYQSTIFRSLIVGLVDPKNKTNTGLKAFRYRTCGYRAIQKCGEFYPQHSGKYIIGKNKTRGCFEMDTVPGCEHQELKPFSLHFPGPTKKTIWPKFVAYTTDKP